MKFCCTLAKYGCKGVPYDQMGLRRLGPAQEWTAKQTPLLVRSHIHLMKTYGCRQELRQWWVHSPLKDSLWHTGTLARLCLVLPYSINLGSLAATYKAWATASHAVASTSLPPEAARHAVTAACSGSALDAQFFVYLHRQVTISACHTARTLHPESHALQCSVL
jgi:hypothetical protein